MQCYFITQYINFTNQIPTVQVSNIYMLNIFADIKQSRQAIAIRIASLNSHYKWINCIDGEIIIRMKLFMTATKGN